MPDVLSAFGEFRWGDNSALEQWLLAHDLRHIAYSRHFKLPYGTLRGPVDGDWMLRHQLHHMALAKVSKDSQADLAALGLPDLWRTQQELTEWQLPHSLMHQQIEGVIAHGG